MCAFKKPSTPSYGVKLFVSLVLLAISLCLVNCAPDAAVTVVKKPVEIESSKVAADITASLNAELAKLPAKAFLEAHPNQLSEIIPVSGPSKLLKPSHVAPAKAGDPVTDFEFVLPHGKAVKDYVDATLKGFKIDASDEAKIKAGLIAAFAKTIEDLKTELPIVEAKDVEIEKNLLELETLLMQNFENHAALTKSAKSDSTKKAQDTDKGLFSLLFGTATLPFEPVVYVPKPKTKSAQEEFVEDCVGKVVAAATASAAPATAKFTTKEEGAKLLLNSVLENLGTKDATKNEAVEWSDMLVAMKTYSFEGANDIKIGTTAKFVDADFKFTEIAKPADAQVKFFVPFGKFDSVAGMNNDVVLVEYLGNLIAASPVTGTDFNTAFSALIKLVEGDIALKTLSGKKPAFNGAKPYDNPLFLQELTIKNEELVKLINEALKSLVPARTITVTEGEIKLDDKSFFTFDATTKKLKGEFPLRSDDKSTDEEIIKRYIDAIVATLDLKKSDADVKQDFFTKFVAKETVAATEKEINDTVQAEAAAAALKLKKTEGDEEEEENAGGEKKETEKKTEDEGSLPVWAWVLIGVGSAGALAAIIFVVYMKVVNKEKM